MTIYQQLNEREVSGNPIRVGVIGAGQMGFGMISQIATIPGMTVNGVSDIRLENAQRAKDAYLAASSKPNSVLASTSYHEVIASQGLVCIYRLFPCRLKK